MTALLDTDLDTDARTDFSLPCLAVEPVTHDVTTFHLAPPAGGLVFEAGQYLTVTVDVAGERLSRCYSISSPPTRPEALAITVKRVPGGPVSNHLHDRLRPGDHLDVTGPLGVFTPPAAGRLLFLSAGSGITPLMSAVRHLVDLGRPADVVLVHHARTPADVVFRSELASLSERHPGVRVEVVCEDDAPDETWAGHRGRLSAEFLAEAVPDAGSREVFVCGPPAYRATARSLLGEVHEESYVLGETGPDAPAATPSATAYAVELRRSGITLTCGATTRILDAAAEAGLTLPSSCREGVCGTCKTTMLSGTVEMAHNGGIRPREVAQGKVLPCCSSPTSDVVLDA